MADKKRVSGVEADLRFALIMIRNTDGSINYDKMIAEQGWTRGTAQVRIPDLGSQMRKSRSAVFELYTQNNHMTVKAFSYVDLVLDRTKSGNFARSTISPRALVIPQLQARRPRSAAVHANRRAPQMVLLLPLRLLWLLRL